MTCYKKIIVLGLLLITPCIALCCGRYKIQLNNVVNDIFNSSETLSIDTRIILNRIPRICMALLVGAALSSSGMVYQCLFRNPLVSPDILGLSSGACLGAAIAICFHIKDPWALQLFSFLGGIIAVVLVYYLALCSHGNKTIVLVMSGIIISSLCNSLLSFLKYIADPTLELPAIVFWMMGGFHQIGWHELQYACPTVCIGLICMYLLRYYLNILSLGDTEAQLLGINVPKFRLCFIILSTLMVGTTVSMTGIIGWVGLVIPHMTRLIFNTNHTKILLYSMAIGAIFLLIMDTLARTITTQDIPIGILTSLLGAPFFAYLLLFRSAKNLQ